MPDYIQAKEKFEAALRAIEGVAYVKVEVETLIRSTVTLKKPEARTEVYNLEEKMLDEFPEVTFDFRLSGVIRCCDRDEGDSHLPGCVNYEHPRA